MSLGERIAKVIAPQAVSLTTDYISRLRNALTDSRKRVEYLERENKRLRRQVKQGQSLPTVRQK